MIPLRHDVVGKLQLAGAAPSPSTCEKSVPNATSTLCSVAISPPPPPRAGSVPSSSAMISLPPANAAVLVDQRHRRARRRLVPFAVGRADACAVHLEADPNGFELRLNSRKSPATTAPAPSPAAAASPFTAVRRVISRFEMLSELAMISFPLFKVNINQASREFLSTFISVRHLEISVQRPTDPGMRTAAGHHAART